MIVWFLHDFHTSLTEINYNVKEGSLEVSVRVFTDDLEATLTKLNNGKQVKIENDPKVIDPLLEKYLRKTLALVGKNKEVKFGKFYGKEKEADATWIYLEFFDCKNLSNYTIYNTIFLDMFSDQTNLMNVIYPTQKKTLVFKENNKTEAWPF